MLAMSHQTASSRLPEWVRRTIGTASQVSTVEKIVKQRSLHTICEEGRCPNRAECYAQKTATFLLMGPVCTRACGFCQVAGGKALPLDPQEPEKVAESVVLLALKYVVLTSVARDDLPDQGAGWFVRTMESIRARNPETEIEVLTPDFAAKRRVSPPWSPRGPSALITTSRRCGACKATPAAPLPTRAVWRSLPPSSVWMPKFSPSRG